MKEPKRTSRSEALERAAAEIAAAIETSSTLSVQTRPRFLVTADRFFAFCRRGFGLESLADVTPEVARAFVGAPLEDGEPSVATMHLRRAVVRFVFRQARALGLADHDPCADLSLPPRSGLASRPLTDDEIVVCRSYSLTSLTNTRTPAAALLHWRIVVPGGEGGGMRSRRCGSMPAFSSSAFAGFRFPPEIIVLALRWYLRYGLSYRDVEELLAERGIEVDHVTVYRWVQRFTPLLADAALPCRHAVGDRWFVDETYVKVAGKWRYVYRAVDQYGQIIDVYVSLRRDTRAARRFFTTALDAHGAPTEIVTDRAPALRAAIDEFIPGAFHNTEQYANNRIECDHGRLKARLQPMRGLKRDHSARVIVRGHALMQNIRRGHYELGIDARAHCRVASAFTELARTI